MKIIRPVEARDETRDMIELTAREREALRMVANVAERAASLCAPDSAAWLEWKSIEHRCNEAAEPSELFAPFGVKVVARA